MEKEPNPLEQADLELGRKIAGHGDSRLNKLANAVGKFGDQEPMYALSGALILAGLLAERRRWRAAGMAMLCAVAAADASKRLTKKLVRRTRPHVLLQEGRYDRDVGGSEVKPEQSFPSGHVAGTLAAAQALARYYPRTRPAGMAAVLLIAGARLAKGAHWPLDVAAGAVLGLVVELATRRLWKR